MFTYATRIHTEMFNLGVWQDALVSKPKSSFIFWENRCWNCEQVGCNKWKCPVDIDEAKCDKNQLAWKQENNKGKSGANGKKKKSVPHQWRPPTTKEGLKRTINGKPHTWNGKGSWKTDNTPDSGLQAPGDTAAAAAIALTGQKSAAAAITAATAAAKALHLPTTIGDDATSATGITELTQDQANEISRLHANIANMGTDISQISTLLSKQTKEK